jgi:tRNA(fMet)-specific endonuclease VapC
MTGRYALDTNIVIALIDRDISVRDRVVAADEIFIPSPVLGELYFGAFQSDHPDANVARIDDLARWYVTLSIDDATAKIYGRMRRELKAKGRPIPENDIWIAATSQQWSLAVATRDVHFDAIDGLAVEKW